MQCRRPFSGVRVFWTTVKAQTDKIASWSARMVANVNRREKAAMDGIEPVVETVAQNWPSLDREGQHERVDGHQRTHAQLGWSCCPRSNAGHSHANTHRTYFPHPWTIRQWRPADGDRLWSFLFARRGKPLGVLEGCDTKSHFLHPHVFLHVAT